MKIDLSEKNWKIVEDIIHQTLPSDAKVYVFGSRVKGTARRGSDLDLAFDLGRPLTRQEAFELAEAFEESDLPIMVDVVDLHRITPTFRAIVESEMVEFFHLEV